MERPRHAGDELRAFGGAKDTEIFVQVAGGGLCFDGWYAFA